MSNNNWPDAILDELLRLQVRQVAYVPDAGHRWLIEASLEHPQLEAVSLTTEEEGIAVLAGAWLGGQRGVLLMQSSGVGNCMNMLSLPQACRMPLLMLVTMRGQWAEFNPWQIPMGQNADRLLELCGTLVYSVDNAEEVGPVVRAAGSIAFSGNRSAAVLIAQRLIGAKTFAD